MLITNNTYFPFDSTSTFMLNGCKNYLTGITACILYPNTAPGMPLHISSITHAVDNIEIGIADTSMTDVCTVLVNDNHVSPTGSHYYCPAVNTNDNTLCGMLEITADLYSMLSSVADTKTLPKNCYVFSPMCVKSFYRTPDATLLYNDKPVTSIVFDPDVFTADDGAVTIQNKNEQHTTYVKTINGVHAAHFILTHGIDSTVCVLSNAGTVTITNRL